METVCARDRRRDGPTKPSPSQGEGGWPKARRMRVREIKNLPFSFFPRPLIRPCGAPSPLWGEGHACGTDANQYTFKDGRDGQRPFLFPCRKKKRFLESKEKGAPVGVEWSQIGFRRPGFTPPLRTSTVHSGLPGRNRDKPWSYPTFFRRLRGWASGVAPLPGIPSIAGRSVVFFTDSLFTITFSLLLWGAASRTRPRYHAAVIILPTLIRHLLRKCHLPP